MSVHGTAEFATRQEVRDAGLIRSRKPGEVPDRLMVGYWINTIEDFEPIEYSGDLHQLIVGGTGGGKFTTALAPMLLGSSLENQTVVAVDPKGELANLAGPFFEIPFYPQKTVHILDPWDQCKTGQTAVLNVLDSITTDNSNYVDDARALADAMIIPSGGENTHWDNAARNFLTAILLYVALSPKEKDTRDLLRVREIVALTWALPKAYTGPKRPTLSALLFELLDCELAGGAIKRGVSSLLNREDKERSGIISSIDRDTSWIDSPQMAKVLRGKSLDLAEAARGGRKYFIVLPPDFFMTHRAWLRLMVTAFAKAFKRTPADQTAPPWMRWRHIVIDEFANLGEMSFILNDIAVSRGFGVKYHLAIQDLSQLARVYSQGWESFINNSFQRFFAVSDMFTAEYVSRMLGAATVQSRSFSTATSEGTSFSRNAGDSFNQSRNSGSGLSPGGSSSGTGQNYSTGLSDTSGWSRTDSVNLVQRPLMTADEVRRMLPNSQLLFIRGMHPIEGWRPKYWEIFLSLPTYSLREIWGTIGRSGRNAAEVGYFTDWRMQPLLRSPGAKAIAAPAVSPKPTIQAVAPVARTPRYGLQTAIILAVAALVVVVYWFLSQDSRPKTRVVDPNQKSYNLDGYKVPPSAPMERAEEPTKEFPGFFAPAPQPAAPQQQAGLVPSASEQANSRQPVEDTPQPSASQDKRPIPLSEFLRTPREPATQKQTTEMAAVPSSEPARQGQMAETCTFEQRGEFRTVGFKPICGQLMKGGASLGSAKAAYQVARIDECALYCRRTDGCALFSYDPRGRGPFACILFGAGPVQTQASGWVTMVR